MDLLVFFPASPRLWEGKPKDTEQKLWCHLTFIFGRNQVREVIRLPLVYLISLWLRNENALFKSNPFGCWVKEPMFCRCEAPTDWLFILSEELQRTAIILVLPASCKDTIRQMLWHYSSDVFFQWSPEKMHILLGSSFLWAVFVIASESSPSSSP